jgi:hypothetical protein
VLTGRSPSDSPEGRYLRLLLAAEWTLSDRTLPGPPVCHSNLVLLVVLCSAANASARSGWQARAGQTRLPRCAVDSEWDRDEAAFRGGSCSGRFDCTCVEGVRQLRRKQPAGGGSVPESTGAAADEASGTVRRFL